MENIDHIGKVGEDFNGDYAKQVKDANSIFFEDMRKLCRYTYCSAIGFIQKFISEALAPRSRRVAALAKSLGDTEDCS